MLHAGKRQVDAALCWVTDAHASALGQVVEELSSQLDIPHFAGCVAPGVVVGGREVYQEPAVAVMTFAAADPRRFHSMMVRGPGNEQAAHELASAAGDGDLAVTMISTSSFEPRSFLAGLSACGSQAVLAGGGAVNLSGPDLVFTEQGVEDAANVALVLRGCRPRAGLAHSCRALSRPLMVTSCRGRMLARLDGRPALDVLEGLVADRGLDKDDLGKRILVAKARSASPLGLARGEFVVRPLLGVEDRLRALYLGAEVSGGSWLTFVLLDVEPARMEQNAMLTELAGEVANAGKPSFGLLVNCSGRGPLFHRIPDYDATVIRSYLPGFPVAGFYSGFEIEPNAAQRAVHLFTQVMALGW